MTSPASGNQLAASLQKIAQRCLCQASAWLSGLVEQCRRCRECEQRVRPMDDICSQCGAAYPARIPISMLVIAVSVTSLGLLTWRVYVWLV